MWYITIKNRENGMILEQNIPVDVINKGNRFLDCQKTTTHDWFCVDMFSNVVLISNEMMGWVK